MSEIVIHFDYDSKEQAVFCEQRYIRICELGQKAVSSVIEIGRCLHEVRDALPGKFKAWVDAYLGASRAQAYRWMKVYSMACRISQIEEFWCVDAILEFADLPPVSQRAIIEYKAYRRVDDFKRVAWNAAVRADLEDECLDKNERLGRVLHAIEEAKDDEALGPVAQELYKEHREIFARLSDREPEELDVEVGIVEKPDLPNDRPSLRLVTGNGYYLCQKTPNGFHPVSEIQARVVLWPGGENVVAFIPGNGWSRAAQEAVVKQLGVKTLEDLYGEIV